MKMFDEYSQVRITVLKKLHHKALIKKYTDNGNWPVCQHFQEGQQFIVSEKTPWEIPPGFCGWAWADIQKLVWAMARGGPNIFVTCCTDGFRPVLFKLEKIDQQEI
ncbi:MAG: TIGR04076 family protein [Victivallaceae bacterium]